MKKWDVMKTVEDSGIIAVIRKVPKEKLEHVAESLISGGVKTLEFTMDTSGALQAMQTVSEKFKGQVVVGAGTVLDSESALLAIQHGADFIFSPTLNVEVIKTTLRYGKISVPGVMTPTEMLTAVEHGADLVKVFPANSFRTNYIKEVRAPMPQINIVPTGGINLDNIASFVQDGVIAIGLGSSLLNKQMIVESRYQDLSALASQFIQEVKNAREKGEKVRV